MRIVENLHRNKKKSKIVAKINGFVCLSRLCIVCYGILMTHLTRLCRSCFRCDVIVRREKFTYLYRFADRCSVSIWGGQRPFLAHEHSAKVDTIRNPSTTCIVFKKKVPLIYHNLCVHLNDYQP